jgi:hypothetical protein
MNARERLLALTGVLDRADADELLDYLKGRGYLA